MSSEIEKRTEPAAALPATLADKMDYARTLAVSGLLPEAFCKKPENILVAQEYAYALHVSPMVLMAETSVIGGKLAMSAKFMRALARRDGHKIRESMSPDGVARCTIIRNDDPDYEHVVEWTQAMAQKHGYWGKGHWQKNPGLMLRNRALAECVRLACPEVLGGIAYTDEEVRDMTLRGGTGGGEKPVTAAEILGQPDTAPQSAELAVEVHDAEVIDEETGEVLTQEPPSSPASPGVAFEPNPHYDDEAWQGGKA